MENEAFGMENEAFVDGELESLLGMFNFDQCSSNESSFCNAPNEFDVVSSSDDFFPFSKILQGNYAAVLDGSNHQTNLYDDSRQELVKPRKKQKISSESNLVTEPKTAWRDGQSLSNYNSSDDENALGLVSNTSKSLKRKAKSNKGIASDPQSLYARKRRERINDRLKTLQSLVPNGTKVDISTMLEDAVHYVKFLQLQIKLLSSDDLWMYALLAHNGLNMGLHHNILSRLM
ncbi:transcription factor bHLH139 [Arabidopsis lyrata subsp. lyrata]|nr:transcription factor bHLH139 [Arabidopsis lyrata subsp. lyrata]XP_020888245.1 transcription factor bHLH139 [Arabidopsis lyrata subsp. lyrata]|eukprot:XP_002862272.2 transcription factor bHLH139 [Arabidopsis lyrata subsp. lyrata]